MRSVSPAEAHCPIRPQNQHSESGDRGRAQHRIAVCFGMGERTGKLMEMLPMDAGDEVVEAEEESHTLGRENCWMLSDQCFWWEVLCVRHSARGST